MANLNPYDSPQGLEARLGGRSDLIPVAISLIVVAVLGIFGALFGVIFFYMQISDPDADPQVRRVFTMYLLYPLPVIAYSLVLISGAFSMVRRGSYVWAVATSCLALVPGLGPCYFLAIPIGLWALVVLRRPAVRDSFRSA